jgi:hypothetical protein
MAATLCIDGDVTDPVQRRLTERLEQAFEAEGRDQDLRVVIRTRSRDFGCERFGALPTVPILVDGKGILVGPLRSESGGCICCALARRSQNRITGDLLAVDASMLARGTSVMEAHLVLASNVVLRVGVSRPPYVTEISTHFGTVRRFRLRATEECHCMEHRTQGPSSAASKNGQGGTSWNY